MNVKQITPKLNQDVNVLIQTKSIIKGNVFVNLKKTVLNTFMISFRKSVSIALLIVSAILMDAFVVVQIL